MMSLDAPLDTTGESAPLSDVPRERYEVFRHPRRLYLLEFLDDNGRQSLADLTTELLERAGADPSNGQRRHEVRIDLVHAHLPKLDAAGLVDWDLETGAELVGEPPATPAIFSTLLEADHDVEELVSEVVDPVRLRLLELVDDDQPRSLEELASTLAACESAAPADPERAKIVLHHSHLPALEGVDLLTYDRDSRQVAVADDSAR
ncbi:hypothetical protein AArcMg_3236 [Natrarchaeobaculum sulfurireducens]|uniref:DUF7344 domain-containing protein n=2 Tax=Natrarchaeobaculum sulfurireducens TaxID=2044521 RepID=A0A346PUM6_9EURY|nr:hypothetical protein AArcMg_3236 [Natrarchaeobaculum sulfurireducens]